MKYSQDTHAYLGPNIASMRIRNENYTLHAPAVRKRNLTQTYQRQQHRNRHATLHDAVRHVFVSIAARVKTLVKSTTIITTTAPMLNNNNEDKLNLQ